MSMMYQRRSRLTPRQQSELIELIVADAPARESAGLVGLLKCGSKVFTAIIPDTCTRSLLPIIEEMVPPDSIATRTSSRHTMPLTSRTFTTVGSITQSSLPTVSTTSTGLRISDTRPSTTCGASKESRRRTSTGS